MDSLGTHLLADLWDCVELDPENYERIIRHAIAESGATLISFQQHEFQPHGYTAVALLAESHLSIHTWPEKKFVAIDYFTCGDRAPCETALEIFVRQLRPENVQSVMVERGRRHQVWQSIDQQSVDPRSDRAPISFTKTD